MGVDARGVKGVLAGSIDCSVGSDRSMLSVDVGADTLLTGVHSTEVGCTLLRFRGSEAYTIHICIVLSKYGDVVRLASNFSLFDL